jgi:hypothetical protein
VDHYTGKLKGKAFITFKDGSTSEYKPANGGLGGDDSDSNSDSE